MGTHTNVRSGVGFRKIMDIVTELVTAVKSSAVIQDTQAEPALDLAARHGFEP